MKTKLTLLASAIALSCGTGAFAAPISPQQAMEIAASFETPTTSVHRAPMKAAEMKLAYTASAEGTNCYYIINSPASQGFTVVSADDRLPQILGYTDRGSFDPENIPCNMRWWLDNYKNEIAWYFSHSSAYDASSKPAKAIMPGKKPIAPITTTTWNQSAPYNNLCPMGAGGARAVTGCVATAMAQVMKVYNWPDESVGETAQISLAGRKYDWNEMLDSYTEGNYTATQARAVALLMRCCGAAVDMNYSTTGSGAYSYDVGPAWTKYFKYDASLRYEMRDYYSMSEWNNMIYNELNEGRPVYYSGASSEGGHAFVCDGYGSNGYFHFNWGWGGYQDGYFRLYALNPTSGGIGSYEGGYNSNQTIYTHLAKRTDAPQIKQSLLVATSGINVATQGEQNLIYWNDNGMVYNPLGYTETIDLGIRLVNTEASSDTIDMLFAENVEVQTLHGWGSLGFSLPDQIDEGIYHAYVTYRTSGTQDWSEIRSPYGESQYFNAAKTNNGFTYSASPFESKAELIVGNMQSSSDVISANSASALRFKIVNTSSSEDYIGILSLDLYPVADPDKKVASVQTYASIYASTVEPIDFVQVFGVEEGDYIARISNETGTIKCEDFKLHLSDSEITSDKDAPVYVPLAAPGFAEVSSSFPLQFILSKTDPKAENFQVPVGLKICNINDELMGSILLGTINMERESYNFRTQSFNFSRVLNKPGYYYWQYFYVDQKDGEETYVPISQKIPFALSSGSKQENDLTYSVIPTKDGLKGIVLPPTPDLYQAYLNVPEKAESYPVVELATDAFAFADSLQSVSLPGIINSLCGGQFYGCTSLERLEIRGTEPPALSKYAFPENAIQGIRLSVADGGANIFKRSAGWSDFFFPSWSITVDDGVVIADGLINDSATGKLYAPYYVSPEEQPELVFNIPEGKSVEITYNFYGHEADVLYSNHSWKMPALRGLDGTVRFALTDWHEDTAGIADTATTDEKFDVYNMQGVCVMRNADRNAINKLQPGIYVAGGRKIIVR